MDTITAHLSKQHAQGSVASEKGARYVEDHEGGPSTRSHIPDEILLEVLSYFIPKNGVTISPDNDGDICPATITSLLQTSRKIRNEILAHTKHSPLRIYIASGKHCQCHTLKTPHSILNTSLGKAAQLPLAIWSEIIVTFVPQLHVSLEDACMMVQRTLKRIEVLYSTFNSRTKCRSSISCVRRQSIALARTIEDLGNLREDDQIRLRFVFNGSRGLDKHDRRHQRPLWDLNLINTCLYSWRWKAQPEGGMPSVTFPKRFLVGLNKAGGFFSYRSIGDEKKRPESEVVRERFEEEFEAWWNCLSPSLGKYIWDPSDFERGLDDSNPSAYWYTWPLRVVPHIIEGMDIKGVMDVYGEEVANSRSLILLSFR